MSQTLGKIQVSFHGSIKVSAFAIPMLLFTGGDESKMNILGRIDLYLSFAARPGMFSSSGLAKFEGIFCRK